jgi:RNA polymerase sigma-70 factor (ECF subfamily)
MAWAMCSDADAARDAVQEAAVRLLGGIRSFRGDSQFRTWAAGILINVVREQRRARSREPAREWAGASPVDSADRIVERQEEHSALRELLDELPERQREALVLRFFEELSVEETAAAMQCAGGTVKATVHQALRSLRERLMGPARKP